MVTPLYVKHGDTIAIVSTARKIKTQELQFAMAICQEWGLNVLLGDTINAQEHQFAGTDALRTQDFQAMLDNPKVKAIWCARGGYGTVRMVDALDFSAFKKKPKWIIGYSDITVLHSHVHAMGIETLHAQMPLHIEKCSKETTQTLKDALFGTRIFITSETSQDQKTGNAHGRLVGGNLSILYSLCGSPSALDTNGKILFIEDLDEYLYHVDRMMQNLKRNGMLSRLAGLIVGGMTDMNDNTIPFGKTAEEIILDTVSDYDFPVCFNFPAGHCLDNRALLFGREVSLEVSKNHVALNFNKK